MNRQAMMMAFGIMLSFAMGGCSTTADQTASSGNEGSRPGLRSENPQEQRDSQERLRRQNMEERRRLEGTTRGEPSSAEVPPYTENQPIGGQQRAGAADFPQPAFPFVKGQLTQIEGEYYILQDAEGKNVRVHVDRSTKMDGAFQIGDIVEAQRTLPGHAIAMRHASSPLNVGPSSASSGMGSESGDRLIKDPQVTLGGAKQTVRGEVLQIDGDRYSIRDGHGNEVHLAVNQNTRILCGADQGSISSLMPAPSASDKPDAKGPQDLSLTAEQPGSEVGPGTRAAASSSPSAQCRFNKGELIEAEVSDMGVATFIKSAGRRQPGQALP
jgi:hypothetical protein